MGGALVGAWLGFHAGTDLLALVTSIVGASAGANLALIGLDIASDRRAYRGVAESKGVSVVGSAPAETV
jgi:hypothetical protein